MTWVRTPGERMRDRDRKRAPEMMSQVKRRRVDGAESRD